jgi:hypothetical protein
MPKRSQHRVSEGQDAKANVRRRGVGSPEPSISTIPRAVVCFAIINEGGEQWLT